MEDEEFTLETTCHFCHKTFESHPDSFIECGFILSVVDESEVDEFDLKRDDLENFSEYERIEAGIDDDAFAALKNAEIDEFVPSGAVPVCDSCIEDYFGENS